MICVMKSLQFGTFEAADMIVGSEGRKKGKKEKKRYFFFSLILQV